MSHLFDHYSFSKEYKKNQRVLSHPFTQYDAPLTHTMNFLKSIMGDSGFDRKYGVMLGSLRHILKGKEAQAILDAVGFSDESVTTSDRHGMRVNYLSDEQIKRAAAIKLLRHVYMVHVQGSTDIWVVSTPKSYQRFISKELEKTSSLSLMQRAKLEDVNEHFSEHQRKLIGASTNEARRLVAKTIMLLCMDRNNANSRIHRIVRRWFSGESVSAASVKSDMNKILAGLKKIENVINSNKLIFTDMPYLRTGNRKDDQYFYNSIAFVFGSMAEKIPIIYVEDAFFNASHTILGDSLHWTNTIIHEISHLILGTKDHRYRFEGLSPDHHLMPHEAMNNADTWSIFCLDACNMMTQYQKAYFNFGRSLRPPVAPPVPPKIPKVAKIPKISSKPGP
ncbi:M35 family metallo-endopeptidase [Glaciecola sp. 1036]|uniref:M35 family metallo-endopeptidase n=1 Tax=Alteromonadaceae TaxID=72275 RepID=UPI003D017AE1